VIKPADWPRYMTAKRLKDGTIGYYWAPPGRDAKAGFKLHAEALGQTYATSIERAAVLNRHLDDWRVCRSAERFLDAQPGFGTLDWLVERYKRTKAWRRVSAKAQASYTYVFKLALDHQRKSGARVGTARLDQIDAAAVDKLYERLQAGPRQRRLRLATMAMMRLARAWDVVGRLYRRDVPRDNPFRGVTLEHGKGTSRPASRDDALALHCALIAAGEPAKPFTLRDARARVRKAARKAGLPEWVTLAACRHGGMTELGDAGATEAETMASSGHTTPNAARLYVKRTEAQRLSAARKRRALRENRSG
jgi:hypothetical protein